MRFKIAFEAAWKALKAVLLEEHGIDVKSPKAVLQEAFQQEIIDDEEAWLKMLEDRNEITHVYDERTADHIYEDLKDAYFFILKKTMLQLKEQFGSSSPDRGV